MDNNDITIEDKKKEAWQHRALKCSGRYIQDWSHRYPGDAPTENTDVRCGFNHRINYECVNHIEYKPCTYETCPFVHWADFGFTLACLVKT